MDQTDEEEYQYQPPEPLDIENRNGAPILLKEFVNQVHPLLNANKDEIYRCVDENFSQLTELEDGTKFDSFDPSESDGADEDEDEDQPTELSPFTRSGNIPTAAKFFFDQAHFNEADMDDFRVYIGLYVEGNTGVRCSNLLIQVRVTNGLGPKKPFSIIGLFASQLRSFVSTINIMLAQLKIALSCRLLCHHNGH